jgi:diguanylate cyclase (GGDEF)-like protein
MMEVLGQHRKRLERSGHHRFCLALLDIDHFKRINDTYGHAVGDEVLRNFSKVVQSGLRDTDVLARWGGEEFLVLLNDTSPELANVGLERARYLLAEATLVPALPDLKPTFSAGLTAYGLNEALDVCIERADRALYKAKDGGRNCTVIRMGLPSADAAAGEPPASSSPTQPGVLHDQS